MSRLNHNKPSLSKASISSARERRRKNKKEGGRGRVVLKSRSAADLCKVEERKDQVDIGTPPDRWNGPNSERMGVDEPDSETRLGMFELDSDSQTDKEDESKVKEAEDNSHSQRANFQDEGGADQPDSGLPPDVRRNSSTGIARDRGCSADAALRKEVVINNGRTEERMTQQGTPQLQCDAEPAEAVLNGHSSDEVEVEEFFTLLDTTLHLPDSPLSPTPFESEDHPGPPLKAFSTNLCVERAGREEKEERLPPEERRLPPGRLADRIKVLRE